MDMIFLSKWSSQTLCAGAKLGVFDWLSADRYRSPSDLAAKINVDPTLLYRLLRALASIGLLNESAEHSFSLTERGAL
jgi:DNA-binding IclR family transcriptional regulator